MSSPTGSPTIAENIRALSRVQKSKAGAPLYFRIINRPAGRVLATIAHRLGMTPDQVAVLSVLCIYNGIALITPWRPTVVSTVATVLLSMFGYALDAADRQSVRLRHGGSKVDEWLDRVTGIIKLSTVHGAIAVSLFRFAKLPPSVLLIPLVLGAVQNIHSFGYTLTYQLRYRDGTPLTKDESRPGVPKSVPSAPTDYGLMCFMLMTRFAPTVFLWVHGIMLLGCTGYVALALPKWYRDLRNDLQQALIVDPHRAWGGRPMTGHDEPITGTPTEISIYSPLMSVKESYGSASWTQGATGLYGMQGRVGQPYACAAIRPGACSGRRP